MKPTLLLTLLPLLISTPQVLAKSDLEILRARCAEQERQIRELEDQNAKLRSLHDLPVNSARLKSAGGTAAATTQAPSSAGIAGSYVVRSGDSWERIARKFDSTPATLASLNGLKATSMLHAGQQLKVPGTAKPTSSAAAPAPAESVVDAPTAGKTHHVKQGETYYSIAKKYGVSSASLIAANPDIKPAAMRPGQIVQLTPATTGSSAARKPAAVSAPDSPPAALRNPQPAASPPAPKTAAASPPAVPSLMASVPARPAPAKAAIKYVTINGSTTFGEFAAKHGTSTDHLNDLNALDLVDTTVLAKGSELYVPAQP